MGQYSQVAVFTAGRRPTEIFSCSYKQCVIFVEKFYILRKVREEQILQLVIIRFRLDQIVPDCDAGGISIDDKNFSLESVKKDRISGFPAYACYAKQLLS